MLYTAADNVTFSLRDGAEGEEEIHPLYTEHTHTHTPGGTVPDTEEFLLTSDRLLDIKGTTVNSRTEVEKCDVITLDLKITHI